MVVKPGTFNEGGSKKFESDVILYGGQTSAIYRDTLLLFESDVILYGGQTTRKNCYILLTFESDVILYGGQTEES